MIKLLLPGVFYNNSQLLKDIKSHLTGNYKNIYRIMSKKVYTEIKYVRC